MKSENFTEIIPSESLTSCSDVVIHGKSIGRQRDKKS